MAIADLAKVIIESEDRTRDGVDSAVRNLQGLHGAFDALKGKFAALGGLLGIGAFAEMTLRTIELADQVNKLAQKTGLTVEAFQRLQFAAKLSDVDAQALSTGIKQLSSNLLLANDPASKLGQVMKALGVDLAGGTQQALERFADVFQQLPDGTTKTALAVQVFGRAGQDLIPLLNQGRAGLHQLGDEASRLGIIFSDETARKAEQFNDNLTVLKAAASSLQVQIASAVVPSLTRITTAMRIAAEESGLLAAAWVGLGGVAAEGLGLNADPTVKRIREINSEISDLQAKIAKGPKSLGDGIFDRGPMIQYENQVKELKVELRGLQELQDAKAGKYGDQVSRSLQQGRVLATAPGKELEDRLRAIYQGGRSASAAMNELADAIARVMAPSSGISSTALKDLTLFNQAFVDGRLTVGQYMNAIGALVRQQPAVAAAIKAEADAEAHKTKILREGQQAEVDEVNRRTDILDAVASQEDALRVEIETLGMSDQQRQRYLLNLQMELTLKRALADPNLTPEQAARIEEEIRARYANIGAMTDELALAKQQASVWGEIGDRAGQFFSDLVQHGRAAFGDLRNMVKQFLADMVALFVKRWVLNLAAGGTFLGSAGSALAGGGGGGSLAGAALNSIGGSLLSAGGSYVGGLLGGSSLSTAAGVAGIDVLEAGGAASAGMMGAYGAAGTEVATSGIMSGVTSVLSSIPVYGWIALAVIAIAAWLSGRGGGPKTGGSFMGSFDAGGSLTGTVPVPGSDNGRFYTPRDQDSQAQQIVMGVNTGFQQALAALGGKSNGITFGFGMDADPRGDAQSRLSAMVQDSQGRVLLNILNRSFDDKDAQAQAGLAVSQMILAGLQASDLPDAVANVLRSVDAASASQDEINNIEAVAQAVARLTGVLSDAIDPTQLIADASRSAIDVFHSQGEALGQLARNSTLTTDSLGGLITATSQYREAAAQLILQLQQARNQVGGSIDDTIRGMRLSSLDQQGQYNFLQEEARQIAGNINTMTDAQAIVDAVNRITQDSNQAFGMLSESERQALLPEFIRGLEDVRDAADQRLHDLQDQVTNDANSELSQMREAITELTTKLGDAATSQQDAAGTLKSGADVFAGAVGRIADGIDVRISVDRLASESGG
jgi:hypothetical protein